MSLKIPCGLILPCFIRMPIDPPEPNHLPRKASNNHLVPYGNVMLLVTMAISQWSLLAFVTQNSVGPINVGVSSLRTQD